MIYHLKGQLSVHEDGVAVIDVNGVGYEVLVPANLTFPTPHNVTVYTHHHIREDQQLLFGFATQNERRVFQKIITVNGVGPKVALKIMGTLPFKQFAIAILKEDIFTITQVPGVGKKLAEKIILELKDKLDRLPGLSLSDIEVEITPNTAQNATGLSKEYETDLTAALKTLGYKHDEIKHALSKSKESLSDTQTLEASIKALLRYL